MSKADAVAGDPAGSGATLYAVFGGADFGAGFWASRRRRRARQAPARADRLGDRPGLGGEPRLADLRARRALDGVLGRVRGDLLDALHPAQPRGARDRAARRRLRVPGDGAQAARPAWRRSACSAISSLLTPFFMGTVVGAIASGRVPVGNATGRRDHQLAEPALAARRRAVRRDQRLPGGGVPRQRRAPRSALRTSSATSPRARSSPRWPRARSRQRACSCCTPMPGISTTA